MFFSVSLAAVHAQKEQMKSSFHRDTVNKKVISNLMLKGFNLSIFFPLTSDINNSGEIDKKDFEIAIQVGWLMR